MIGQNYFIQIWHGTKPFKNVLKFFLFFFGHYSPITDIPQETMFSIKHHGIGHTNCIEELDECSRDKSPSN